MPAHAYTNSSLDELQIWQSLWKSLIDSGYIMIPSRAGVPKHRPQKYFVFLPHTFGHELVDDFRHGLKQLLLLYKKIRTSLLDYNLAINPRWNYLGKKSEREDYLQYLADFFWTNQDFFSNAPSYQSLLTQTWRIIELGSESRGLNIAIPSDFFSQQSIEFTTSISELLAGFVFDPYLIEDPENSFQFSIQIGEISLIKGAIRKEDSMMNIEFEIQPLTGIVF